jgi:hypothetical protein
VDTGTYPLENTTPLTGKPYPLSTGKHYPPKPIGLPIKSLPVVKAGKLWIKTKDKKWKAANGPEKA